MLVQLRIAWGKGHSESNELSRERREERRIASGRARGKRRQGLLDKADGGEGAEEARGKQEEEEREKVEGRGERGRGRGKRGRRAGR
jgi:hypothetical protein